jgi:general stress protein 26
MATQVSREEKLKKLNELIKDVRVAMLTTVDENGLLRSRPMATQNAEFDGDVYFFTQEHSPKMAEVQKERNVNVAYANPDKQHYVSMSGKGSIITDRQKMKEFWNPMLTAWFPKGLDDPELALLKITVSQAEYWDSPNSTIVYLYGLAKAAITGESAAKDAGENEKINL